MLSLCQSRANAKKGKLSKSLKLSAFQICHTIDYLSLSTLNQLLAFETHLSHQNSMTTSETNKLINSMVSFFVMLKDKNESYDYKSFKSFTTRVWCCKNYFNLLLIYLEEQGLLLRTFDVVIILN